MMDKPLKVLHIEDNSADAGLVKRQLVKAGFSVDIHVVDSREDFVHALDTFQPDLILSDHSLPQFNSLEALHIHKASTSNMPFILVTGSVSEEFAIRAIKEGADDYILKNNMIRLPAAISQALKVRKAEAEKQRASRELDAINRELGTFIYKAAHDLRGPLCSVMGLTNVALMAEERDNVQEHLKRIHDSTRKLDDVLLALIDLMTIRDSVPVPTPLNIHRVVDEVLGRVSTMVGFRDIRLHLELQPAEDFTTDQKMLGFALLKMVENTVTYRRRQGAETVIRSRPYNDLYLIEVEDNGVGIDPGILAHIFDMYFKGNQYSVGSGLGLYAAQKCVRRLGGEILVSSQPGKGSVFTIQLPREPQIL